MTGFLVHLEDWLTKNVDPTAALIVVDVQPDFMPGGSLAVDRAEEVLPGIRLLMEQGAFGVRVATQDWHTPKHVSFASSHPGKRPFETIELHGHKQVLWPDHCVQGTKGAMLHPDLPWDRMGLILRKGTDPDVDSYSGFRENWDSRGIRKSTGLSGFLRETGVKKVFVCGLARDVCCKWTVQDAATAGFQSHILWDLTQAVEPQTNRQQRQELIESGVGVVEFVHHRMAKR